MVIFAERGSRSMVDDSTHWYAGEQPLVRVPLEGTTDPVLLAAAEELPPQAKKEGHREIEVSLTLAQEELNKAVGVLEEQGAKRVLEGTFVQVWYDANYLCEKLNSSTSLHSLSVCRNMEIRVRSLETAHGIEYHWTVKVRGQNGSIERQEHEGVVHDSWEHALEKLNEKIAEILNSELHGELPQITADSPVEMSLKKRRISYRYDERPDGKQIPCTGSQVDFDVWEEINGHTGPPILDENGKPTGETEPLLITVDVEGKVLNGDAEGMTPEQARRVPNVENCVWCLSLPKNNTYDLFKMVSEKWPRQK